MVARKKVVALAFGLSCAPGLYLYQQSAQPKRFTFAVLADQDYGSAATVPPYDVIAQDMRQTYLLTIEQINRSSAAFSIFLGDMQLPRYDNCTEKNYRSRLSLFNSFTRPVMLTLGDNDWSDFKGAPECPNNPLEILRLLRTVFFPTNQSLGRSTMTVERQPCYPENQRWSYQGVLFCTFHTIGPDNVIRGGTISEDERLEESAQRTAAAIAWIRESFVKAQEQDAEAVVLLTHADRWQSYFSETVDDIFGLRNVVKPAFEKLMQTISEETTAFAEGSVTLASRAWPTAKKQVYLFYGDSHTFMTFRPMTRSFDLPRLESYHMPYYQEIQVPGPAQGWVEVNVDFSNSQPFGLRVHGFAQ